MSTRRPAITQRASETVHPSAVNIVHYSIVDNAFMCITDAQIKYKNANNRWFKHDGKEFISMREECVPRDVINENMYQRMLAKKF